MVAWVSESLADTEAILAGELMGFNENLFEVIFHFLFSRFYFGRHVSLLCSNVHAFSTFFFCTNKNAPYPKSKKLIYYLHLCTEFVTAFMYLSGKLDRQKFVPLSLDFRRTM